MAFVCENIKRNCRITCIIYNIIYICICEACEASEKDINGSDD